MTYFMVKLKQCHVVRDYLIPSENDMLIEGTSHEYWARGRSGNGLNMLGKLRMKIGNLTQIGQRQEDYRLPANCVASPYHQCGEGHHNNIRCQHQGVLQCRSCFCLGHKSKHCPENL